MTIGTATTTITGIDKQLSLLKKPSPGPNAKFGPGRFHRKEFVCLLKSIPQSDLRKSMRHVKEDVVDPDSVGEPSFSFGIMGTVGPFPGVAHV